MIATLSLKPSLPPRKALFRKRAKRAPKLRKHARQGCIASFMSDVNLYDMSHADIFVMSSSRNLLTFHLPFFCIYRYGFQLSFQQSANITLLWSIFKTFLQLLILSSLS